MKGIIGAITGDVIGSTREFYPIKTKDFELFTPYSRVTDDSILTLAVANWLCEDKNSQDVLIKNLQYFGNRYPDAGYGSSFGGWLVQESPKPYDSWANGSAMRVSPCAWVAESLEEANDLAMKRFKIENEYEFSKDNLENRNEMKIKDLKRDIKIFKGKIKKKRRIIKEFQKFCNEFSIKYQMYINNNNINNQI
jgi:hypothetical protein